MTRQILVAHHSRSGGTAEMVAAVLRGMRHPDITGIEVVDANVVDVDAADVRDAAAFVLATPVRFGGLAGLSRDLLERIYYPCLEGTTGKPYALLVRGTTDASGAAREVERIVVGLRWRAIRPPLIIERGEAGRVVQTALREVETLRCHAWGAEVAATVALS